MKKYLLVAIIILLTLGFTYYFFSPEGSSFSEAEKLTAVEKMLGRDIKEGDSKVTGSQKYEGKYGSFSYPKSAKQYVIGRGNILTTQFVLDSFQFQDTSPKYFANFEVRSATYAATLSEMTAVSSRENSDEYTKVNTKKGVGFEKVNADGAELSSFWKENDNYYTLVVTGRDLAEIKPVFESVLTSFSVK